MRRAGQREATKLIARSSTIGRPIHRFSLVGQVPYERIVNFLLQLFGFSKLVHMSERIGYIADVFQVSLAHLVPMHRS